MKQHMCQVYRTMRTAGYTHSGADSICCLAHGLMINPNLSANKILKAIAVTDNTPMPSKEPNGNGVPDKKYDISAYSGIDDCVNGPSGLVSLGVDADRAMLECSSYFAVGTGTGKGAMSVKQLPGSEISLSARMKSPSQRINAETKAYYSQRGGSRNAGVEEEFEIPSWAMTMIGGPPNLLPSRSSTSHIKPAAEEKENQMYNYMTMRQFQHRDSMNYIETDPEMETRIYEHGINLAQAAETQRIKSGKKEPVDDPRPAWAICAGL